MWWEKFLDFLNAIEPVLLVIIPAILGIWIKIKAKIEEKEQKIKTENTAKNENIFSSWEHEKSKEVIDNIQSICNYYKDIGYMDLVNYIQFENGTTAMSKICNMFLTCLAEDNRFGTIPKMIDYVHRTSYSRLSVWVKDINSAPDGIYIATKREDFSEDYSDFIPSCKHIKSFISGAVKDPNGVLIGICSFYYVDTLDSSVIEQNVAVLRKFITSVETIFLNYQLDREKMKKSLNLA
nr:hypothetical protein DGKKSRWO_DGKKSRWO_CDS_0057 [uncultured phage]CAI9752214.1 hypothetical protein CVNMHQAP_CVNMHQAP_CDS_0057 [uncultured phage]